MSSILEEKNQELINILNELVISYADVIKTNRRQAMNIAGDLLSAYRPEMNFTKSLISEGILESLLGVSDVDPEERKRIIGRAKLSATQILGFDKEFASRIIDLYVFSMGEDGDNDSPLAISLMNLTSTEKKLIRIKPTDISGIVDELELNTDQISMLNNRFANCDRTNPDMIDLLLKIDEKTGDLWRLLSVEENEDGIDIETGTKILGKTIYSHAHISYYGIEASVGFTATIGFVGSDNKIYSDGVIIIGDLYSMIPAIQAIINEDYMKSLLRVMKKEGYTDVIDRCMQYAYKKAVDNLTEFEKELFILPDNNETIKSSLSDQYDTSLDCYTDLYRYLLDGEEIHVTSGFEQVIINLTEAEKIRWKQLEISVLSDKKMNATYITRIGKVGVLAEIEFKHKYDNTSGVSVNYKIYKMTNMQKIADFKGKDVKSFRDNLGSTCDSYTLNKEFSDFIKRAKRYDEKCIDKRIEISESIIDQLSKNSIEYSLVQHCNNSERIANEKLFDLDNIKKETKSKNIYWGCLERKQSGNTKTYIFETYYSYAFIYAFVTCIRYNDGKFKEKLVLSARKEYELPKSKEMKNGGFEKLLLESSNSLKKMTT